MHELPVVEKILEIALRHGRASGAREILTISLQVGGLTDLKAEWLQRYFEYLSKDTMAENARLIVQSSSITIRCGGCRTMIETERQRLAEETCPHCGASDGFSILSGKDYFIEEMTTR